MAIFDTEPINDVIDDLPNRSVTTYVLRALDIVAPDKWTNPTGWEATIREVSGESSAARVKRISARAIEMFEEDDGYRRALWCFQSVDSLDRIIAGAALANKVGERFDLLRFLTRVTPKPDVVQSIDLALKLTTELIAWSYLNGTSPDGIRDFVRSLGQYSRENAIRMAGLVCIDGLIPLGPDFLERSGRLVGKADVSDWKDNRIFRRLRQAIPGGSDNDRFDFVRNAFGGATDWLGSFSEKHDLSRRSISSRIRQVVHVGDESLDYVAALLDGATNYYAHTGAQTVARELIQSAADTPAVQKRALPRTMKVLRQRQRTERDGLKTKQQRERERLQTRHDRERHRFGRRRDR